MPIMSHEFILLLLHVLHFANGNLAVEFYVYRLYKGLAPLWGRQIPCKFTYLLFSNLFGRTQALYTHTHSKLNQPLLNLSFTDSLFLSPFAVVNILFSYFKFILCIECSDIPTLTITLYDTPSE